MAKKRKNNSENELPPQEEPKGSLFLTPLEEVLPNSMLPYAEYVILDRALPRVEDGLKPVQRRILYTMYDMGLTPTSRTKRARVSSATAWVNITRTATPPCTTRWCAWRRISICA